MRFPIALTGGMPINSKYHKYIVLTMSILFLFPIAFAAQGLSLLLSALWFRRQACCPMALIPMYLS